MANANLTSPNLWTVVHVLNRRSLSEHWVVCREAGNQMEWVCNRKGGIKRFKSCGTAMDAEIRANESEGHSQ